MIKVVISRNRVEVIPLFACLLGYYLIKRRRITIKMVIFCLICACLVIYVVYALRAYRWYGTIDNFLHTVTFQNFNEQILEFSGRITASWVCASGFTTISMGIISSRTSVRGTATCVC